MDERNNHSDFDFTPIGQAIKKAREARGMTREELSGIIGYAPRHIFAALFCLKSAALSFALMIFSLVVWMDFCSCLLNWCMPSSFTRSAVWEILSAAYSVAEFSSA